MSDDPGLILLLLALQNAVLLVITLGAYLSGVFVLRRLGRGVSFSLAPLGFSRPANGYLGGIGIGVAVGLGALVASFLLNVISRYGLEALGYPEDHAVQQPLMQGIRSWVADSPMIAIPLAFLVVAVVGPVAEELVFRGGVFNGLHRLGAVVARKAGVGARSGRMGEKVAFVLSVVVSSALFASLHLEAAIFLAIFVLAASLCWLFRRTGSLLPPVAAHATFNAFTVAVLVLSGLGVLPEL